MTENKRNGDGCTVLTAMHLRLFGIDMPCRGCCDEHDLFYEQGGGWRDRWLADRLLRECVIASGHPVSAWIMWAAVRVFGGSHWGTGLSKAPGQQME